MPVVPVAAERNLARLTEHDIAGAGTRSRSGVCAYGMIAGGSLIPRSLLWGRGCGGAQVDLLQSGQASVPSPRNPLMPQRHDLGRPVNGALMGVSCPGSRWMVSCRLSCFCAAGTIAAASGASLGGEGRALISRCSMSVTAVTRAAMGPDVTDRMRALAPATLRGRGAEAACATFHQYR